MTRIDTSAERRNRVPRSRKRSRQLGQAALVALDWGTTSLRAYLFDASRQRAGYARIDGGHHEFAAPAAEGGFDAAFECACGAWLERCAQRFR
jgi:2-dehydro-3-deoxygalactonokinase